MFDVVAALLLALAVVALTRAVRDARRRQPPRHRLRAMAGVPARVMLAAIVLGYPTLTGIGWTAMRSWHPDLALTLALIGGVVLATPVTRAIWLVRSREGGARASGTLEAAGLYEHSTKRVEVLS